MPSIMVQMDIESDKAVLTFSPFVALVPESCRASCEGLVDECRHLATSGILDWGSVRGVGAYARASPPPHKLPDGNYSTVGGNIYLYYYVMSLFFSVMGAACCSFYAFLLALGPIPLQ